MKYFALLFLLAIASADAALLSAETKARIEEKRKRHYHFVNQTIATRIFAF